MLRETEKLLKAAGDRTRLRILKMLEPGPLCVCQIVEALGLSQSTVSKHLSLLVGAGLLEDERRGKWTYYGLGRPEGGPARRLLALLRSCTSEDPQVAKDLAKVRGKKVRDLIVCCPAPAGARRRSP